MKVFIRAFLAVSIIFNISAPAFAQKRNTLTSYNNIPIGTKTTKYSEIYPYKKSISISQKDIDRFEKEAPLRAELFEIENRLRQIKYQALRNNDPLIIRQDNTRVASKIPPQLLAEQARLDAIFQKEKEKQEKAEVAKLLRRKAELSRQVSQELTPAFMYKLEKQNRVNKAYELYQQSSSPRGYNSTPPYYLLPEFAKTPAQMQKLMAKEIKDINLKLQESPAYKSFNALQQEVNKINKNKRDDAILMSIFTLVALRGFKGVSISAPSSALAWWSGPKLAYYAKKVGNFISTIIIYGAIDEANLNAINTSFEELFSRFTYIEGRIDFVKKIMKAASENSFGNKIDPLPNAWGADKEFDDVHVAAMRRLYGLRFINVYLEESTVSYKYDLAMLDLLNLFSHEGFIPFDLNVFNTIGVKGGYYVKEGAPNTIELSNDLSLLQRYENKKQETPSLFIQNLSKLPKHIYYKKVYYKKIGEHNGEPVIVEVDSNYIIRDKDNRLLDCSFMTGSPRGKDMNFLLDGEYYMKLEPTTSYNKDSAINAYIFEEINTHSRSCDKIVLMA